jgi:hypothetical protein
MNEKDTAARTSNTEKTGTPHTHLVFGLLNAYAGLYQQPCEWDCNEQCCGSATFGNGYEPTHTFVPRCAETFLCLRRVTEVCTACKTIHRRAWKLRFRL